MNSEEFETIFDFMLDDVFFNLKISKSRWTTFLASSLSQQQAGILGEKLEGVKGMMNF